MKRELIKTLVTILIGLACIFVVGRWTESFWDKVDAQTQSGLVLPSPSDIQTMLNILEPENAIKIDGRIGPATMAKWERVYCNQQAEKTLKN